MVTARHVLKVVDVVVLFVFINVMNVHAFCNVAVVVRVNVPVEKGLFFTFFLGVVVVTKTGVLVIGFAVKFDAFMFGFGGHFVTSEVGLSSVVYRKLSDIKRCIISAF